MGWSLEAKDDLEGAWESSERQLARERAYAQEREAFQKLKALELSFQDLYISHRFTLSWDGSVDAARLNQSFQERVKKLKPYSASDRALISKSQNPIVQSFRAFLVQ